MALKSKVAIEVEIKNIKKIADLKESLKTLRKETKKYEKDVAEGTKQTEKSAKGYINSSKAIKKKSKDLRELNKNLSNSTKVTKKVTKSSNGMAKQFIKGAAAIGVIVGAFRVINRVVSSVVSTFSDFQFVMAKVNAVSGATEEEFSKLTASAEELGRTTFFTATQVGELQLAFSKLGFTAAEIMDAQKATLDLATATGTDLARAAQVAGAAVRGFGLDASETERVVDVMAVSFASSAMSIEKWQTSMTKVAPIAKSAGFSIEDTAAIMSQLADSGIEASIAGTSLRNILLKMQDPTSDLSMNFGKTIHSLDELVPAMKGFIADGGDMADILEVVDLRQAAAFEQMLTTADGTLELRDSLKEANGEGARMAGIVGDTLQGAFLKFTSAVQGISISVMKGFSEGLQGAVENIASFFNVLAKNSQTIIKTIKVVTTLAKWFGIYKITLIAVSGLTTAYIRIMALQAKFAMQAAAGMTVLSRATMVAKRSINALMGATGIGLAIVVLSELIPWLMKTNEELEVTASLTDTVTKSYQDSLKPIEQITVTSKELVRVKGLMNKMTDKEGKLLNDTATNQKIYNKYKGQAAILTRSLNRELKENDQSLITEKTSIEDVAKAIDILTESLTNQALVKGFSKEIEKITEVAANAEITKQSLISALKLETSDLMPDVSLSEMLEDELSAIEEFGGVYRESGEQMALVNKILTEGGFKTFEELTESMDGSSEKIDIITKAFNKLAGGDGIGALILSMGKLDEEINTKGIKNWATETTNAINKVKKERFELGLTEEQYTAKVLSERLRLVKEEKAHYVNGLGDKKANVDKMVAFEKKLVDLQLKIQANYFKEKKAALDADNIAKINSIKEEYTVDGQITAQGQTALINQEILYLTSKGVLHDDYMVRIQGNNEKIAESNRKLHEQQMIEFQQQVSAYASVGSSLTTLAGDNERLNAVKEAGNAISQAANIISTITTLKENLNTISKVGNTAATVANTVAEGTNAVATGVSTAMTLADTTANAVQIPFLATKTILKSGSSLPFPLNLIAIAATIAIISKVMKMFEKGGIVDGGSKFAKGGVISKFADGGMVNGKSHAQGGEKFAVGGRVVELEGGEAVINKRSTAMYRGQLSQMNAAGGGVKFADGGMLNNPSFAQQQFSSGMSNNNAPQKVYVVESDISQSQNQVSVLEAAATI